MSFLKELTDKGATIAWSNVAAHPSLLALGTKVCVCVMMIILMAVVLTRAVCPVFY